MDGGEPANHDYWRRLAMAKACNDAWPVQEAAWFTKEEDATMKRRKVQSGFFKLITPAFGREVKDDTHSTSDTTSEHSGSSSSSSSSCVLGIVCL